MSLLTRLSAVVINSDNDPVTVLSCLRKQTKVSFYLYINSFDNSQINKPAFWQMPNDLKTELTILFSQSLNVELRCTFLHQLDVFVDKCSDYYYCDLKKDNGLMLPERLYEIELCNNQSIRNDGREPFDTQPCKYCGENKKQHESLLKEFEDEYVKLTTKNISLRDIYVGKKAEAGYNIYCKDTQNFDIELQTAIALQCQAKQENLNAHTYGLFAENFIYKRHPQIDSQSMQRISDIAKPNIFRKRHWSKLK